MRVSRLSVIVTACVFFFIGGASSFGLLQKLVSNAVEEQILLKDRLSVVSEAGAGGVIFSETKSAQGVVENSEGKNKAVTVSEMDLSLALALKVRMDELERRLDGVDLSARTVKEGVRYEGISADGEAVAPQSTDQMAEQIRKFDARVASLFNAEEVDPGWHQATSEKIKSAFKDVRAQLNDKVSLSHMDCRSTLCRVEVAAETADSSAMLNLTLLHALSEEFSESSQQVGDNGQLIYYLARKGSHLVQP